MLANISTEKYTTAANLENHHSLSHPPSPAHRAVYKSRNFNFVSTAYGNYSSLEATSRKPYIPNDPQRKKPKQNTHDSGKSSARIEIE